MLVAEGRAFSASIKVAQTLASLRLSFVRSREFVDARRSEEAQKCSAAVMLARNSANMSKRKILASTVSLSLRLLVSFASLSALRCWICSPRTI